jgi:hypothetical protein
MLLIFPGQLKECKNCNERYLARIEILKADMAEIEAYKNKLSMRFSLLPILPEQYTFDVPTQILLTMN